jgi:hypothetical protein
MTLILWACILLDCSIENWFTVIIYKDVDTAQLYGWLQWLFFYTLHFSLSLFLFVIVRTLLWKQKVCSLACAYSVQLRYRNRGCILFYTALKLMTVVKDNYLCMTHKRLHFVVLEHQTLMSFHKCVYGLTLTTLFGRGALIICLTFIVREWEFYVSRFYWAATHILTLWERSVLEKFTVWLIMVNNLW